MDYKIIIVGNGSSLLDKQNGELINSFENVVRFNRYAIEGFEKNVGTKTDILFTVLRINNLKENLLKVKYNEIYFYYRYDNQLAWYQEYLNYYKDSKTYIKKFKESEVCENMLKGIKIIPSSGLVAILNFINIYGKVCITGFDWWEKEKNHYCDNDARSPVHNPQIEKQIIYNLKDQNKIEFI